MISAPVLAREQKGPDSDCTSGNLVAFDMAQLTHPENRSRNDGADGLAPTAARFSKLHLAAAALVRRLTPRECERLQGLPDDWTAGGRLDAVRYRLIGNSVAVPCVAWVAQRLAERIR